MLCEKCLAKMVPKLREDDIAVLQHLYNENRILPQLAEDKYSIGRKLNISYFKSHNALFKLECFGMVELVIHSKIHKYYLLDLGIKALESLSIKMEG